MKTNKNIVLTGPTASGKTELAVALCRRIDGEIISVDSRQVYRGMDIGTGKDLGEYSEGGPAIPYHLIDICDPGEKYNVYSFQEDAARKLREIRDRHHVPVLCGGSGLYLEAVINAHQYTSVPVNEPLRVLLQNLSRESLLARYTGAAPLPFTVDRTSRKRLIRAIEMQEFLQNNRLPGTDRAEGEFICFLIDIPREERRKRISERLDDRLAHGLVSEVRELLKKVSPASLIYYGLEYKYVTEYLTGELTRDEMHRKLETAIHRYAKRQMTWFRRMETKGTLLHRVNGMHDISEQLDQILPHIN